MSWEIQFVLNDKEVRATASPGTLALDFLRQHEKLTGVKEGCREGDCGACTILIGTLENSNVRYRPVTSCLIPVAELHGKHVVTVEGLNLEQLSPVQQAIVDAGATQCGFCTPGIVVSLTSLLLDEAAPIDRTRVKAALSGHLCRCTGYRSLKSTAAQLNETVGKCTGIAALVEAGMLPASFRDIPARLQKIPAPVFGNGMKTPAIPIAGGTDLYVQIGDTLPESEVAILSFQSGMQAIEKIDGQIHLGALTTFEAFARNPLIRKILPEIQDYMFLIASLQIRHRATLGGNLINASPIGDMTILLLALDCQLVFDDGETRRTVPLTAFYKGYKQLDKSPAEILTKIILPVPTAGTKIHFEKVSKRKTLDIASVNSAVRIRCDKDRIADFALACGGVAPVPLFMKETSRYFLGKPLSLATVFGAMPIAQKEIAPISDIRGSAIYKRLLVRQLLIGHFTALFPEQLKAEDFYATS